MQHVDPACRLRTRARKARKLPPIYLDECLERRILFDLTIDGTSGNDKFVIDADSGAIVVNLNGVVTMYNNPADGQVNILGHSGNDDIDLRSTGTNTFFLTGNDGNDSYEIGDGNLGANIGAPVHITELEGPGNGGNDSVTIDDSFGGGTTYNLDVGQLTCPFPHANGGFDPIYFQIGSTDTFKLIGSQNGDALYAYGFNPNTTIQLQGGDDALRLDASGFIPLSVSNLSIDGGQGNNLIKMFNYGQIGTSTTMGNPNTTFAGGLIEGYIQTSNFTRLQMSPDPADAGLAGVQDLNVTFTGPFGPASQMTLTGNAGDDTVNFGTAANPLTNASLYTGTVTLNLGTGTDDVVVYDGTTSSQNWDIQGPNLFTDGGSSDVLNFATTGAINWFINGGSGADTFQFGYVPLNWNMHVNGGGGNDLYEEFNGLVGEPNGGHNGDIDAIIVGGVTLDGGTGTDTLVLDDTADQIGDADEYRVTGTAFTKGDSGQPQIQYYQYANLDDISLTADTDPNTIRIFNAGNLQAVTLNGAGGSDTFLTYDPVSLHGAFSALPAVLNIQASAGTDFLGIDDTADQTQDVYDITSSSIVATDTALVGNHTINYDTTLESLELDESAGPATTRLMSKVQAMPLVINEGDGNDTMTVGGGDIDSNGFKQNNTTLNGGAGTDTINFYDVNDAPAASESEIYVMNQTSFGKGTAMLTFTNFEVQNVDAADFVPQGQLTTGNEFDINAVSLLVTSTTIFGGNLRASNVILALPGLNGALTLAMGTNLFDTVTINDQTISTNKNCTLTSTALTTSTGQTVNYSGVEYFTINASTGNNNITLGNGNIDGDLPLNITVNGNAGTDSLLFDNSGDNTLETESLDAGVFTDNLQYPFTGIESLAISEGPGGGTLNLNKVQIPVTVQGRGNSTVNVGAGDLTDNWFANVTFNGAAGNDKLVVDDSQTLNGPATYQWDVGDQFHSSNVFREPALGSQTITASLAARVLKCGLSSDIVNVNSTATGLSIFGDSGNDQINVFDSDGPVGVDTGTEQVPSLIFPFGDYINVNTDASTSGDSGGSVKLLNSDDVYSVTVNSSTNSAGLLQIPTGDILNITHDMTLTGAIDMAGGALALAAGASQVSQFGTWIKNGRKNNTWTGTTNTDGTFGGAINSSLAALTPTSTAVGFAPASALFTTFPATYFGKSVTSTTMLVRYTTLGDATLSAKTNALDFNALATNFGKPSVNWYQGDFNYDGNVNTADFTLLSQHFNSAVASPPVDAPAVPSAAVNSPTLFSQPSLSPWIDDVLTTPTSFI
jgi:hypothetical protein